MEMFEFQSDASTQIATRFAKYFENPVTSGRASNARIVPYYQSLASITASGKTVIVCDALSQIATGMAPAPIVLWISKGRVVVEQTYANLLPDGKYHGFIPSFSVRALAEFTESELTEASSPFIFFATVSTFNEKDREEGTRLIFKSDLDTASASTWDALTSRKDSNGCRRPLIIVYDEAHNLTDQQTDILFDLEPSAFILASATLRLPEKLSREVAILKSNGMNDADLITHIEPKRVADSGLVKDTLLLAGYRTSMEEAVSQLIEAMGEASNDAAALGLRIHPKAIYVCNTNIVEGDGRRRDDPKRPFLQREAPPIKIWRYLTEQMQVDPRSIAVYCSLAFDRSYPPPPEFVHFKGGDKDYAAFTEGNFRHVIFNLSLQEGWDDPECYFAYVDKSMESKVQIEQIVGRALRQPGAKHYPAQRLNTAHFFVRVDKKQVFSEIIDIIGKKLETENPHLRVIVTVPGKEQPVELQPKVSFLIPSVAIDSGAVVDKVAALVDRLTDYSNDTGENTQAVGSRAEIRRKIGQKSLAGIEPKWTEFHYSGQVRARWIFEREIRRRHSGALGIVDTSGKKFDAKIGIGSRAEAQIVDVAERVVEAFLDGVQLTQKRVDEYRAGTILVKQSQIERFSNSVHEGYDSLGPDELAFARELDKFSIPWARNPSRVGYGIPLTSMGPTKMFYPDFIVKNREVIFLIDPKGGHLLVEAAARKLLTINAPKTATSTLSIVLLSKGKWNASTMQMADSVGWTRWRLRPDGSRSAAHHDSLRDLLSDLLK